MTRQRTLPGQEPQQLCILGAFDPELGYEACLRQGGVRKFGAELARHHTSFHPPAPLQLHCSFAQGVADPVGYSLALGPSRPGLGRQIGLLQFHRAFVQGASDPIGITSIGQLLDTLNFAFFDTSTSSNVLVISSLGPSQTNAFSIFHLSPGK